MNRDYNISVRGLFKANHWRFWIPRLLAVAVGLILLSAALLKATDMELFIRHIRDYGIMSQRVVLALSAWGFIILECGLGVGLLVFYRPRVILPSTAMLLLIFMGASGWALLNDTAKDCGCFGAWLKRTPGEAIFDGFILLSMTVTAFVLNRQSVAPKTRLKAFAVVLACFAGFTLPILSGFPLSRISQSKPEGVEIGLSHFEIQGPNNIDLKHGSYLITLMDTDCLHCQETIDDIDTLAQESGFPVVIALFMNGEEKLKRFKEEFQPMFPVGRIKEDLFWDLLADGDLPRTILIRDRRIQYVWDETIPDRNEIEAMHHPSKQ